jgi:hypothetical protein
VNRFTAIRRYGCFKCLAVKSQKRQFFMAIPRTTSSFDHNNAAGATNAAERAIAYHRETVADARQFIATALVLTGATLLAAALLRLAAPASEIRDFAAAVLLSVAALCGLATAAAAFDLLLRLLSWPAKAGR